MQQLQGPESQEGGPRERERENAPKGRVRLPFITRLALRKHSNLKLLLLQKYSFNSLYSMDQLLQHFALFTKDISSHYAL